ncbi:MAG: pantoate--beta-alanine ligase, partial [Pseudonocardiales bacterium]|nr:pantoate--beta-alanine ligase [Pseudonocardiales bacterium]
MRVVQSRAEFAAAREELAVPVGLVPTMGALHAGHVALLDTARAECASVITTNFVNPMQFGPGEDLARYPRTLDADLDKCERAGVDLVWAPSYADVYRHGAAQVTVQPGPLGDILEGGVRPGHFAGVLTVVAKFLNIVRPDAAYFGEKDYQQLTVIRQMAADLDLGADIV